MRIFCSICKELFTLSAEVCVTKCGHLYHENCLKLWQKHKSSCPQCRTGIRGKPDRVFFNTEDAEADSESDVDSLRIKLDSYVEATAELKRKNEVLESAKANLKKSITAYEEQAELNKEVIKALQEKVNFLSKEKERLLPLQVKNKSLKAELKLHTKINTLLWGTEKEVRQMLSKTPVTSLAVRQLCIYVEALKYQLKKREESNRYKEKDAALMIKNYAAALKLSSNIGKQHKENKTTSPLGKMDSDSDEENEVYEGKNLKRPGTHTLKFPPECHNDVACSSNIFSSDQSQASKKICTKAVKKVINNLDKTVKKDICSDSSDVEMQVYPGPGKIKMFRSCAARDSTSIFDKLRNPNGIVPDSESSNLDVPYEIWGGRRKNLLAVPSKIEELRCIRHRHKNIRLKSSRKNISCPFM